MALISFLASNPTTVTTLNIEQIVANAGDGKLSDDSPCCVELREYLAQTSPEKLGEYANHCSTTSFLKGGFVLQDVINELGRRLDYSVKNERYQGTSHGIGFDGIWHSPEGQDLVVEVKTTDAYRISLNVIARYRDKLHDATKVGANASTLLVVGREDTGELEAQVRGSRHAWDMRLISVDALLKLVKLTTDSGVTGAKVRSILVPLEYTRLDGLVDVMFTATKDVVATAESVATETSDFVAAEDVQHSSGWQFTEPSVLREKRVEILSALGSRAGKKLIKRSQALYWDTTHTYRAVCTLSKRYTKKGQPPYWYAYHPGWDEFLAEGKTSYFVLGCVDLNLAFALPLDVVRAHLQELNETTKPEGDHYWHVEILEPKPGKYALQLPKKGASLPLDSFLFQLSK